MRVSYLKFDSNSDILEWVQVSGPVRDPDRK